MKIGKNTNSLIPVDKIEAEKAGEEDIAGQGVQEESFRLMQMVIEQQKSYIQMLEKGWQKKDAAIADLRALVEELQSLKANLEETLEEFRRQFFGMRSEKAKKQKSKKAAPRQKHRKKGSPRQRFAAIHVRPGKRKQRVKSRMWPFLCGR